MTSDRGDPDTTRLSGVSPAETILSPSQTAGASPETLARPGAAADADSHSPDAGTQDYSHRDGSAAPYEGMVLQGHYQLEHLIGRGAMGQVWRARDLLSEEAGERNAAVALKLFVSDLARAPNALA